MRFNPFHFKSRKIPAESKASAVGAMVAFHRAGRAAWTPRDMSSLIKVGYAGNAVAFRSVRMISETAAAIPFDLFEGERRLIEHPLRALLDQPNPAQTGRTLLETLYSQLLLAGNAYIEAAAPSASGAPRELHALRPDRMRVVPGADGWPSGYDYTVGGKTHRFTMSDEAAPILHLRTYHPLDDHYGMSPLEAAAMSIDIHNSAASWSKALLDNAARPSGAIVYSGPEGQGSLSSDQYSRLVDELESHHQGARNAGRPMLLEGGLDWKPMGFSPSDMEFLQTKNAAARDIALAFGVPPMLLGLLGDNTYSNYQEANRAFYRQTIMPLAARICAALTGWLGPRFGEAIRIKPDLDASPALATERDALWARVGAADFLDDDEKRRLLGFPPRGAR